MQARPNVLILDDGESNQVGHLVWELGLELLWHSGDPTGACLPLPKDILITNKPRSLQASRLVGSCSPTERPAWICMHNKDFSSLRGFLSELGVHFLIHTGVEGPDLHLLRFLFMQLAHPGEERRQTLRLPCSCRVQCLSGSTRFGGELKDLAIDSCRIETTQEVPLASAISVYLPCELDPAAPHAYMGIVIRIQLIDRPGPRTWAVVVGFQRQDVQKQISTILAGQGIGTRIIEILPPPERSVPEQISMEDHSSARLPRRSTATLQGRLPDRNEPLELRVTQISSQGVQVAPHPQLDQPGPITVELPGSGNAAGPTLPGVVRILPGEQGSLVLFDPMSEGAAAELRSWLGPLEPARSAGTVLKAISVAEQL